MSTTKPPVKRKYRLVRLGRGDYLLPSNDGKTLWRIYSYEEQWPGVAWGCDKLDQPFELSDFDSELDFDPTDWKHWRNVAGPFGTRAEAIDAVLR